MITNKIKLQFAGRVGNYDVHLIRAKGLKRFFMTNINSEEVVCSTTLIERKDLGNVDYNICVDIFQHIWKGQGESEIFRLDTINWKHTGQMPGETTMRAFVNRFNLSDVIDFHDEDEDTPYARKTTISALIITKFNLEETGFLDDFNQEDKPEDAQKADEGE